MITIVKLRVEDRLQQLLLGLNILNLHHYETTNGGYLLFTVWP